jgi:hypothetical protein
MVVETYKYYCHTWALSLCIDLDSECIQVSRALQNTHTSIMK